MSPSKGVYFQMHSAKYFQLVICFQMIHLHKNEGDNFVFSDGSQLLSRYFCEERRLRTFTGWPINYVRPVDLAKTGFIFTGSSDVVRCVFCL